MKLLWTYLRRHIPTILMLAAFCVIFTGVAVLYRMPAEAGFFAALLCLLAGGVFFLACFSRYVRRHRLLRRLMEEARLPVDRLPEALDLLEEDYQEMLETLSGRMDTALARQEAMRQDMLEYYTLWAHQIKTPLAAMGLILQEEDTPLSRELQSQLFTTERYVDMVLAYLRLGSDSADLVIAPCPLEDLVRQSVRRYAPLFIRREIRLDLGPMAGETVLTDEKWLAFALEQVLSNALKYTPSGGTVTISAEDGRLTVADTGIGIAPEDLPRVWEMSYTGRNGRLDKRATGIGLYLTRRILRRLGHDVSISSRPGAGTAVTFDLSTCPIQPE